MEPTLTWLDFTSSDRDRMRRVLDLLKEQGTVDEMGLGNIRDALSDALFPGTSSIQTRLRYMLFVPWIYRRLDRRLEASDLWDGDVANDARKAEVKLIGSLQDGDDTGGIIGARSGASLQRLPSSVYWSGLVRWGIFTRPRSQSSYHAHFTEWTARDGIGRADDPGVVFSREQNWHPRLPDPPSGFPRKVTFALRRSEAEFLQGRIMERCPGTLLAWLAVNGSDAPAKALWQDPDARRAPQPIAALFAIAERFSRHVEGMPLLYNLLLAKRCREREQQDERGKLVDHYREAIAQWAQREAEEEPYDPEALWQFLDAQPMQPRPAQRHFVERWAERIRKLDTRAVADDRALQQLVADRERVLKGKRARLVNDARLLEWNAGTGVGRMDFRWARVRTLLQDLHRGLAG